MSDDMELEIRDLKMSRDTAIRERDEARADGELREAELVRVCQKVDAGRAEVERLQAAYDALTGEKFSDRCHVPLRQRLAAAEYSRDAYKKALVELVACKDLKDYIEEASAERDKEIREALASCDKERITKANRNAEYAEYRRRKGPAWSAARTLLSTESAPTPAKQVINIIDDVADPIKATGGENASEMTAAGPPATGTGKEAVKATPSCPRCKEGWVCEAHPDKPWPHDDCAGPGMPCPCMACYPAAAPTPTDPNRVPCLKCGNRARIEEIGPEPAYHHPNCPEATPSPVAKNWHNSQEARALAEGKPFPPSTHDPNRGRVE